MPDIELKITLPNTITMGIWTVFAEARLKYTKKQQLEGKEPLALVADWYGSVECIRAGLAHVEGPDELVKLIIEGDLMKLPTNLVGLVVSAVGDPIVQSVNAPLPISKPTSSDLG